MTCVCVCKDDEMIKLRWLDDHFQFSEKRKEEIPIHYSIHTHCKTFLTLSPVKCCREDPHRVKSAERLRSHTHTTQNKPYNDLPLMTEHKRDIKKKNSVNIR